MTRNCFRSLVLSSIAALAAGLVVAPVASADSASWNGVYNITFLVGPKSGTSVAATQPEQQYTDTYTFESRCASDCVATIVGGPAPRNPTVPQPVRFTWDGSSWTQANDLQWDCMLPDATTQPGPARTTVSYTPQQDGSLAGTMHTDILSGPCQGTVEINMTAEPA